MNDWKEKIAFKGDKILWYIVIMLMIVSVMVVYSSTGRLAYNEKAGNTFFYLIKQLFLIGGCFGVMFIVQSIHYRYFYKYAGVLLFVSMILLVCAAFGGTNINGAGRWIRLPLIGLTFQPSELAKIAIMMFTARILSEAQTDTHCDDSVLQKFLLLMVCVFVSSFGADKSLETVKEKGYFIVGLDATFAPMGYRDESGEIVGFDIDLAKEVAKRMGVEARFKPCEWDAIIFDLRSKNIDMVWNGMTITPARAKQVAFTKPYLSDNQIIFTRKGTAPAKVQDLAGKVVGVQLGSSGAQSVEDNPINKEIKELKKYATNVEALMDLEAGRLDAVVMDEISGKYYNAKKSTLTYSVETLADEDFGVALRKQDKALVDEINRLLDEMKADGTFDKIKVKWLGK